MRTLVLGGARSGKSGWAESLIDAHAPSADRPVDYIATARPWGGDGGFDEDFSARIGVHRRRRPGHWRTVDDVDAVDALQAALRSEPGQESESGQEPESGPGGRAGRVPHVLLDDVGTWLTHVIDREGLWDSPRGSVAPWADGLVDAVSAWPAAATLGGGVDAAQLVIVTPEVGMGVIPEHRSGRLFRDEIGLLNGRLAEVCDRVVFVAAGLPMTLKA